MDKALETPTRKPKDNKFVIVTFKEPFLWSRSIDETWMFNPPRRYILNANHIAPLEKYIETVSELANSRNYRPVYSGIEKIRGKRILIERYRDRGIGDHLFLTGPMAYLQHLAGGQLHLDIYALNDRAMVFNGNPHLAYGRAMLGPVLYDDLPRYDYHWFSESVTEFDETTDQINVYDALYKQIGIDPTTVSPKFKRPVMALDKKDFTDLDSAFHMIFQKKGVDLRVNPYYVVAPLSNSTLRTAPYSLWLRTVQELAKARPVVVIGHVGNDGQIPASDMSFGQFFQALNQISEQTSNILNMIGSTTVRTMAALMARSVACVTLDSGPLYIAQALRVPTVSLWGTHNPYTRIGYDADYMKYAIWRKNCCTNSPCYAYSGFPVAKCPQGESQVLCEVLAAVNPLDIITKIEQIESTLKPVSIDQAVVPVVRIPDAPSPPPQPARL